MVVVQVQVTIDARRARIEIARLSQGCECGENVNDIQVATIWRISGEARGLVNVDIRYSSLLNILLDFIYLVTSPSESFEIAPL